MHTPVVDVSIGDSTTVTRLFKASADRSLFNVYTINNKTLQWIKYIWNIVYMYTCIQATLDTLSTKGSCEIVGQLSTCTISDQVDQYVQVLSNQSINNVTCDLYLCLFVRVIETKYNLFVGCSDQYSSVEYIQLMSKIL